MKGAFKAMLSAGERIDRREFFSLSGRYGTAATLLGVAGASGGAATLLDATEAYAATEEEKKNKAEHVLVMASTGALNRWPDGSISKHQSNMTGFVQWKDYIEAYSDGKIYVDVHLGGSLGGQIATARKVQQGSLQGCHSSTQNMAAVAPVWNAIDFPYQIGPVDNFWKVCYSKDVNDTLRERSKEQGVIVSMLFPQIRWIELRQGLDREIRLPQDVQGLKIRVTGSKLEQTAFEILPANPTPVAWPEVYNALKDGAVDGIHVAPGPVADANISEVIGTLVDTKFFYNTDSWWVSTKWYNSLPKAMQEAIDMASYQSQIFAHDIYEPLHRHQIGVRPDSPPTAVWQQETAKQILLTDEERAQWVDFLSYDRNKDVYDPLIERFGRDVYETAKRVAHEPGEVEQSPWWK